MCLIIDPNKNRYKQENFLTKIFKLRVTSDSRTFVPLIAKEDITVYKDFYIECKRSANDNSVISESYVSPYQHTKYALKQLYTPDRWIREYDERVGDNFVEHGIHAYVEKGFILDRMYSYVCRVDQCECVIPKGSEYFIGKNGDIVSNKLIILRVYNTVGTTYYNECCKDNMKIQSYIPKSNMTFIIQKKITNKKKRKRNAKIRKHK